MQTIYMYILLSSASDTDMKAIYWIHIQINHEALQKSPPIGLN